MCSVRHEGFLRLRFGKLARASVRAPRGNTVGQYRTPAHTALSLFRSRGEKELHVFTEPSVRRVAELEAKIEELELKLDKITSDLETASADGDTDKVTELGSAYTETESALEATMDEWGKFVE